MSRRTHDGLYDTGYAYRFDRFAEFFFGGCEAIWRCGQSEIFGCETPYAFSVHGEQGCCCRRCDMIAFLFKLDERGGCYGLDFRDDMVGLFFLNHTA